MKWIKKENYWNSLINARKAFEHKRNKEEKDTAGHDDEVIWSAPSLTVKNRGIRVKIRIRFKNSLLVFEHVSADARRQEIETGGTSSKGKVLR